MSRYPEIRAFLAEIATSIDEDLSRVIKDTHDYSSSSYSGFDDGFNTGCDEATEEFIERLIDLLKECTKCGKSSFHEKEDYICIICREQEYQERVS